MKTKSSCPRSLHRRSGLLLLPLLLATSLTAQTTQNNLVVNGDFETWNDDVAGTPPAGSPTQWGKSGTMIRSPGLVPGSNWSGNFYNGTGGGTVTWTAAYLRQHPTDFRVDFLFASADPNNTNVPGFSFGVTATVNSIIHTGTIGLRLVTGTSTGKLSLQARNSTTWETIAANAFDASVYDLSSNTFTTSNVYRFVIDVHLSGVSTNYSISYGLTGTTLTTLSGLTILNNTPDAGSGISNLVFNPGSAAAWALDNVVMTEISAIPESAHVASVIAALGLMAFITAYLRRR
ncbi:MAG: hypothetical protein LBK99_04155 [Opitutaceae bacterium]|jgi:hypothetical protein|nr:hypothetical protein [Opitutaceae bacterium]